eukprot:5784100-Amphidinium_carterae.1
MEGGSDYSTGQTSTSLSSWTHSNVDELASRVCDCPKSHRIPHVLHAAGRWGNIRASSGTRKDAIKAILRRKPDRIER